MGMRKYLRAVAKGRLQDLGVEHINRHFSYGMGNGLNIRLQRTKRNREMLHAFRLDKQPLWRQALYGDIAVRHGMRQRMQSKARAGQPGRKSSKQR